MIARLKDELHTIARADDLHVAPFRDDGMTLGPTWIWSIAVDDVLYVPGYNGTAPALNGRYPRRVANESSDLKAGKCTGEA